MDEKNIKDELWALYEDAKKSGDIGMAFSILAAIERGSTSLEDDRRK